MKYNPAPGGVWRIGPIEITDAYVSILNGTKRAIKSYLIEPLTLTSDYNGTTDPKPFFYFGPSSGLKVECVFSEPSSAWWDGIFRTDPGQILFEQKFGVRFADFLTEQYRWQREGNCTVVANFLRLETLRKEVNDFVLQFGLPSTYKSEYPQSSLGFGKASVPNARLESSKVEVHVCQSPLPGFDLSGEVTRNGFLTCPVCGRKRWLIQKPIETKEPPPDDFRMISVFE